MGEQATGDVKPRTWLESFGIVGLVLLGIVAVANLVLYTVGPSSHHWIRTYLDWVDIAAVLVLAARLLGKLRPWDPR